MSRRRINRGRERRDQLREGVADRATERAKRTPQEQLGVLDARLGLGHGAAKERARLQYLIENPPQKNKKKEKKKDGS